MVMEVHREPEFEGPLGRELGHARALRAERHVQEPDGPRVPSWLPQLGVRSRGGKTRNVALGLGLAALSLPRGRRTKEHYGGWDRFIV
jgi:hypothetical protein